MRITNEPPTFLGSSPYQDVTPPVEMNRGVVYKISLRDLPQVEQVIRWIENPKTHHPLKGVVTLSGLRLTVPEKHFDAFIHECESWKLTDPSSLINALRSARHKADEQGSPPA